MQQHGYQALCYPHLTLPLKEAVYAAVLIVDALVLMGSRDCCADVIHRDHIRFAIPIQKIMTPLHQILKGGK